MNHENDTKTQKKEGRNRQNVHFCSPDYTRECPEERTKGVSYTNNPSEIHRSHDEPEEYSEPYIASPNPRRETIELGNRRDECIGFFFTKKWLNYEPKREKHRSEEYGEDITIVFLRENSRYCGYYHLYEIEEHSHDSAKNRISPSREKSSFSDIFCESDDDESEAYHWHR